MKNVNHDKIKYFNLEILIKYGIIWITGCLGRVKEIKSFVKHIYVVAACLIIIVTGVLLYNGIILFNNPSLVDYPVRGVDISSYQGKIDWDILAVQGIRFVFVKATEGSSFQDERFSYNWQEALNTDLMIGAYHFFSFDSSGQSQAENFIKTVPDLDGCLPPVIDIEYYGDKEKNPPDKEDTVKEIDNFLVVLEEYYGVKPVIYATEETYEQYVKDNYPDYPIWIRNVYKAPVLADGRVWTFWQYSNRGRMQGFLGDQRFIDLNVFNGTVEELISFCGL